MASTDLQSERTTDWKPFNDFLYTQDEKRLHEFGKRILRDDPAFNEGMKAFDYTRDEQVNLGLRQGARYLEWIKTGVIKEEDREVTQFINHLISGTIHSWMFTPCIEDLGTTEQVEKWVTQANAMKIIGCYNQTELGHGSDIQRLETTATYDPATQEFILNSPTVSSTKTWPGGLAFTATHCVTQAQCYTQGKHVGLMTFMVQIKDQETWQDMPGIESGELGPKIGVQCTDNGWLRFNNYRVPREAMLARLCEVLPDGTFERKTSSQVGYGGIVRARYGVMVDSGIKLGKASVITTRYSVIRRQFPTASGEERKVLDYQMQASRVLTQLATSYVFKIASTSCIEELNRIIEESKAGNFENLGTLHTESACFKVFTSKMLQDGVEVLRQCCGGHGFSVWSGLPHLFQEACARVTYDGENHMLFLQTSKRLLKHMGEILKTKTTHPNYQFLSESVTPIGATTPETFQNPEILVSILKSWIIAKIKYITTTYSLDVLVEEQVELYEIAFAFFVYRYACKFVDRFPTADPSILETLQHILATFVISSTLPYVGSLQAQGILTTPDSYTHMRLALKDSIGKIRTVAVALTDAFDFTDDELLSALGCYDGDAYNRLFECYKGARFNTPEERGKIDGALKYLAPLAKL